MMQRFSRVKGSGNLARIALSPLACEFLLSLIANRSTFPVYALNKNFWELIAAGAIALVLVPLFARSLTLGIWVSHSHIKIRTWFRTVVLEKNRCTTAPSNHMLVF